MSKPLASAPLRPVSLHFPVEHIRVVPALCTSPSVTTLPHTATAITAAARRSPRVRASPPQQIPLAPRWPPLQLIVDRSRTTPPAALVLTIHVRLAAGDETASTKPIVVCRSNAFSRSTHNFGRRTRRLTRRSTPDRSARKAVSCPRTIGRHGAAGPFTSLRVRMAACPMLAY